MNNLTYNTEQTAIRGLDKRSEGKKIGFKFNSASTPKIRKVSFLMPLTLANKSYIESITYVVDT